MIIEYIKGEMVVKHQTGHVDRYQALDIEEQKETKRQEIAENTRELERLQDISEKINLSIGAI